MIHYPPSGCAVLDHDGPGNKDNFDPTKATCPTCQAWIESKANQPPKLEWVDQFFGTGDSATCVFSGCANAMPIEPNTLTVEPPAARLDSDRLTGLVTAIFKDPVPKGVPVKIRFAWRPPRLRGAKIRVTLPDGTEEWAALSEVADAIRRGGMGR